MTDLSGPWLALYGGLALIALVPIVWAIVDLLRRPASQFSSGRKALWAVTLGVGWLLIWPLATALALSYLLIVRRRLPEVVRPPGTSPSSPPAPGGISPAPPVPPPPPVLPPAAWYADPAGGNGQRWWDGLGWSDHVRPPSGSEGQPTQGQPTQGQPAGGRSAGD
ncbi:MAG TPA: DUF2510 domain-containing protein [Acidimicrobiales bacterium]|nr:DUF2510 domain-containing protein [Acidimicrobiales bacterium]